MMLEEVEMLFSELLNLKKQLESGVTEIDFDNEKLLAELEELEINGMLLQESLSLSSSVCSKCGRRL